MRDELMTLAADLRAAIEVLELQGEIGFQLDAGVPDGVPMRGPGALPPQAAPARSAEAPADVRSTARPSYSPPARPPEPPLPIDPAETEAAASRWAARAAALMSSPPEAPRQSGPVARQSGPVARPKTLEALRAELGDCRRCALANGRKNLVFGIGNPQADLAILGEGPGEQEDRQGEPFVGPAGQMLDRMLENVLKLSRTDVYILNAVKCRPPQNRNPEPDELATCMPFTRDQLRIIRPKVLLLMGNVALAGLLDAKGITRARGKWVTWEGIDVLPTFHPAYLLRKPEDKPLAFEDLKAVARRLQELRESR